MYPTRIGPGNFLSGARCCNHRTLGNLTFQTFTVLSIHFRGKLALEYHMVNVIQGSLVHIRVSTIFQKNFNGVGRTRFGRKTLLTYLLAKLNLSN